MTRLSREFVLRATGVAAALLFWEVLGRISGDDLLAPPSAVLPVLVKMVTQDHVLWIVADSLRAMLAGYGLAAAIALPLGVAMGQSPRLEMLIHPWLSMWLVTSVAAVVPVLILMLGTGFWFRVAVVLLASVWFMMLAMYQGARGVDQRWIDVGRSFGAGRLAAFRKIFLPALLPYVLVALRIGLTHAIRAMVVAELFVIVGYGRLLHDAGFDISTAGILSLLVLIACVGLLGNILLNTAARVMAPWSFVLDAGARSWGNPKKTKES